MLPAPPSGFVMPSAAPSPNPLAPPEVSTAPIAAEPVEVAPVEVAPVEVAPVEVAPVATKKKTRKKTRSISSDAKPAAVVEATGSDLPADWSVLVTVALNFGAAGVKSVEFHENGALKALQY